jgi:hypothetical protein
MKKSKIDRLIESVRKLKEEGIAIANTSNSDSLGFDPETETPPVKNKKRRIYMKGMRSWWKNLSNNK